MKNKYFLSKEEYQLVELLSYANAGVSAMSMLDAYVALHNTLDHIKTKQR